MFALGFILCLQQQAILSLSLGQSLNRTADCPAEGRHLHYLHDLLPKVHKESPIAAILVMQHQQDTDCLLQQLNMPDWPVLRLNEMSRINMSTQVNRHALALVCIANTLQLELLNALAYNFNGMREARIIVWLKVENPKELLWLIAKTADRQRYYNVLVLQAKNAELLIHRMQPFPLATFKQLEKLSAERIFVQHWRNFQGKTAVTMPTLVPPNSYFIRDHRTGQRRLSGFCYQLLMRFCKRHNISLSLMKHLNESVSVTTPEVMHWFQTGQIDLSSSIYSLGIASQISGIQNTVTTSVSNQVLIVPCGEKLSFKDIFETILPEKGYVILVVYLTFALLESLSSAINNFLLGHAYNFRIYDILINLRVIRGFLGLASPIGRRNCASLRQILIALAFFGLFGSSWFNANLSTLLTRRPHYEHVKSYEELAACRLPVVFDLATKLFIEHEFDKDFIGTHFPNAIFMPQKDKTDLILALNTSYAYQTFSYLWSFVADFQKIAHHESLCYAKVMDIAKDVPVNPIAQNNSVYGIALKMFIQNAQSGGLDVLWKSNAYEEIFLNMARNLKYLFDDRGSNPQRFNQLIWLWKLLFIGQGISLLVFVIELSVAYGLRRRSIVVRVVV